VYLVTIPGMKLTPAASALIGLAVVIVIAAVVFMAVYLPSVRHHGKSGKPSTNTGSTGFPKPAFRKTFWTYWNSEDLSPFLKKCVASWTRHHPDYDVVILTPANLHKYTNVKPKEIAWNDNPARESDIVRLNVIAAHGGVWSDASILLMSPLPFLSKVESRDVEFAGYYIEMSTTKPEYPVIESWWFAAWPGGSFITKWRDAFMGVHEPAAAPKSTIDERLEIMKTRGVDFQNINIVNYLFIHVAAQYVLQKLISQAERKQDLLLLKAEDEPFKYLVDHGWDSSKAVQAVVDGKYPQGMIKMRGCERGPAEKHTDWVEKLAS
jgi:hypothetical protein